MTGLDATLALSSTWKVSDIIENGSWSSKEPALQNFWYIIQQIPISINSYSWYWTATDKGVCTSSRPGM